nr:hypothetical protein A4A49_51439 [Ipomoea trifida]
MLPYCSSGAGLRSFVNENLNKILVEVITYCDGSYGRFLVLVSLGIGCTVWYRYAPGSVYSAPEGGVFTPFNTYSSFFDALYDAPNFRKIHFLERNDISESVANAIGMSNLLLR